MSTNERQDLGLPELNLDPDIFGFSRFPAMLSHPIMTVFSSFFVVNWEGTV
jgi:hypothetical protein